MAVSAVFDGQSLDTALPAQQAALVTVDKPLAAQLAYGVLRDWRLLEWFATQLTHSPPKPPLLSSLLAVGLYQLRSTRIPEHAAVAATVDAVADLKLEKARGMVNAVLRRFQRERAELEARVPQDAAVRCSHPDWLLRQLRADWREPLDALLAANQTPAPMWLRVNLARTTLADYARTLAEAGIRADLSPHAPAALKLAQALPVGELPGFAEGLVSVQDAAAQLAAPLLHVESRMRVLDACAAPGGKTAHLLETHPDMEVLALDRDSIRLTRVSETLQRLQLEARTQAADALRPEQWWDRQPFDRILLDAPCSGTGVIRRHPDIKWLRRESDIPKLAATQSRMLAALWPLLKSGGQLLYATCSTLQAEGDAVVGKFAASERDAGCAPIAADWGEATRHGRRIAPGQDDMDGFYFARLVKR